MITDEEAEKANDYIKLNARHFADARAQHIYLKNFRKSRRSMLYNEAPAGSNNDKLAWAERHEQYLEVLLGLKEAGFKEEKLRWEMTAAQAKIEMYRTQQANMRQGI